MRVWVDGWQMQCCGDAFANGERVEWMGSDRVDAEFFGQLLPPHEVAAITHAEERHGDGEDSLLHIVGTVTSTQAVFCRYEPSASSPKMLVPAPQSGTMAMRTSTTGWEAELDDGSTFLGYVVDVVPEGS
ncbi:MAG: hypothetical protein GY698_13150 [Actinomycetia bacterium]|nr:hypothetical protein [Actinomycetes bacterium]